MTAAPVDAVGRVRALVDELKDAYLAETRPRAMLLVGSAVTRELDGYSDVDLLLYYDAVPSDAELEAAPGVVGAEHFVGTVWPEEGYSERYDVGGIHCQLGTCWSRYGSARSRRSSTSSSSTRGS